MLLCPRGMRLGVIVVGLIACGGGGSSGAIDAPPQMPDAGRLESCLPLPVAVQCIGGVASVRIRNFSPSGTMSCSKGDELESVPCTMGCTHEGYSPPTYAPNPAASSFLGGKQAVYCKERLKTAGSPCSDGMCPSAAVLASDGTIASHDYLQCVSGTCQVRTPPASWDSTKVECDFQTWAIYGVEDVNGAFVKDNTACLLAWDSSTNEATSAVSSFCLLDSECPSGALCDNEIAAVPNPTGKKFGVCKPGPRGVLTPAMLVAHP